MATCTSVSMVSKQKAYDLVAHYFIYYVSCNGYNKCDVTKSPPSKCNNAVNRKALWAAIDQAKARDRDFLNAIANLACNIQLGGDNTNSNEQAKQAALRLVDINNVADQVKCGYSGPKGGGGGNWFDMNNLFGLGKNGIFLVGGGLLMMLLVLRR